MVSEELVPTKKWSLMHYCVLIVQREKVIGYFESGYSVQDISKIRNKIVNLDCH